ncbi:PH domain-containing protein [Streptomyces sp. NPDC006923]|uniref:PH domain-containing protein n=1 Tax=Streptomyces sp. NPDC006923 TaxID=3155355 RepID=UPI0033C1B2F3
MSAGTADRSPADPGPEEPWGRLHPRLILVNLAVLAAPVALFLGSLLVTGGKATLPLLITVGSVFVTFLVICGISLLRLLTTRYRVTGERVEVRSGFVFHRSRSLPVDRIRSLDLTANPVHRVFGLTTLRIGAGGQGSSSGGELSLDGISVADAEELRRRITERRGAAPPAGEDNAPILALDWAWLRYGPLTVWGVGGVFAALGTVYRILDEMQIDPLELGIVKEVADRFGSVPLWCGVLVTALIVVALGVAGSTATFAEGWYGYRLERQDTGMFRVRRGMLVTRSVTIEERRLRGVEIIEPIPLRWAGGAKLSAVASGLGDAEENRRRRVLTPPSPRAEVLRVAAEVLAEDESPTTLAALVPHPRVALRRRLNRALSVTLLTAAVPVGLGLWLTPVLVHIGWILALVLLPLTTVLARDAYRTLGHGIHGRYLVTRAGTFAHRTVALQREGIVGWTVTRSFFQRRAGLLTLGATTGAGSGVYRVRDVTVSEGLSLAEEAVPRLLAPFVERVPARD